MKLLFLSSTLFFVIISPVLADNVKGFGKYKFYMSKAEVMQNLQQDCDYVNNPRGGYITVQGCHFFGSSTTDGNFYASDAGGFSSVSLFFRDFNNELYWSLFKALNKKYTLLATFTDEELDQYKAGLVKRVMSKFEGGMIVLAFSNSGFAGEDKPTITLKYHTHGSMPTTVYPDINQSPNL